MCSSDQQCLDSNAVCSSGQCVCRPGFYNSFGSCGKSKRLTAASFHVYFETSFSNRFGNPLKSTFLFCRHVPVSSGEEGTLDAPCLDDGGCLVENAYCNQKVCKCQPDFFDKMGECGTRLFAYLAYSPLQKSFPNQFIERMRFYFQSIKLPYSDRVPRVKFA